MLQCAEREIGCGGYPIGHRGQAEGLQGLLRGEPPDDALIIPLRGGNQNLAVHLPYVRCEHHAMQPEARQKRSDVGEQLGANVQEIIE